MSKMEPTTLEVQELRTKFLQKVNDDNKDFHNKDLARANSDDKWLKRFLLHHDLDMKEALNMLIETCQWRKSSKANEISESNVNLNYLNDGSVFVHSRDKDGRLLLIFVYRKNLKGQKDIEESKKVVIYWMERLERQDKGEPVTLFFDMQDSGLSNLDMEYIQFIVSLFNLYYPNFLNYILIFDMPWVLNAAFKIIKTWLPAKAVQRIKFVDKKSLKEYVDSSQALKSWGGLDQYEFIFTSESAISESGKGEESKKKVHFANGSHAGEPTVNGFGDTKHDDSPTSSPRLSLNPGDAICFNQDGVDFTGTLNILNVSETHIIYKVKTTSPEKFGVRPCCGILSPSASAAINVILLSGYTTANILRDKFLVMSYPLENNEVHANTDLNKIWKSHADSKKLEEHRLRCRVPSVQSVAQNGSGGSGLISPTTSNSDFEQKITQLLIAMNHLTDCNVKMQSQLTGLKRLVLLLLFLVVFFVIIVLEILLNPSIDGFCTVPDSSLKLLEKKLL